MGLWRTTPRLISRSRHAVAGAHVASAHTAIATFGWMPCRRISRWGFHVESFVPPQYVRRRGRCLSARLSTTPNPSTKHRKKGAEVENVRCQTHQARIPLHLQRRRYPLNLETHTRHGSPFLVSNPLNVPISNYRPERPEKEKSATSHHRR